MAIKKAKPGEKVPAPASDKVKRAKTVNRVAETMNKSLANTERRGQSDSDRKKRGS